ncbi:MAG: signal peptidase signal peptidase [Candidatus Parcubacteria bacterium]|nr:signal peptidase signal peptidase [Candidatus Parcubacteria bacterium]
MVRRGGFWKSIGEWVKVILIALIIALPIRFFIAEPFVVNGASMDPTFSTGQFLIVDRLTYDFKKPSRGDVIVFEYPNDPSVYYIKRVIGLPGEIISVKDGKVSIAATPSSTPVALNETYVEQDHASHDTVQTRALGPTEYFVMGDNRAQSSDSRAWGPLDAHFIIGRPIVRLTPLSAISILPGHKNETQVR